VAKKQLNITVIDMKIMRGIFGEDSHGLQTYLKNFIRITAGILQQVNSALETKSDQAALDYFHQLKGPVGSIGFKKMYRLCEQCESLISAGDWVSAMETYAKIEATLKALEVELDKKFKPA